MAKSTFVDKQSPPKPMAPHQPEEIKTVGGKVFMFDGKTRKSTDDGADPGKKPDPVVLPEKKDDSTDMKPALDALRERLGFKKKEPEVKKEEKAAEEVKVDVKPAEEKKEPDDKPKAVARKVRPGLTKEVVEAVAESATRAALEVGRVAREKSDKVQDADPELSDSDKRNYEVIQFMESKSPSHKGLSKKFIKFVTKDLPAYRDSWEKENPGKEFDPKSEDHDSFYEKHEPQYDQGEFDNARIDVRVEAGVRERTREIEEKYSSVETEVIEQKLMPEIGRRVAESVHEMVQMVDPQAAKYILEKGADQFAESDPIAFEALDRAAADLQAFLVELEKLTHPSGKFRFKKDNPVHGKIDRFAADLEAGIKALPVEDQIKDGKLFATVAEFRTIPETQKDGYWMLDLDTIRSEIVKNHAQIASKIISTEQKKLESWQKKYSNGSANTTDGKTDGSSSVRARVEKPNSPAAAVDAGAASSGRVEDMSRGSPIQTLVNKMFPS